MAAEPPNFAYLVGSDRVGELVHDKHRQHAHAGVTDIYRLRVTTPNEYKRVQLTPGYLRQSYRHDFQRFSCLLNLVTDADANPKVLAIAAKLLRDFRGRVINPPQEVARSGRDAMAKLLAGVPGLRVPVTLRADLRRPATMRAFLEASGRA
ncbi:MAG: hypothetical protein AVDCRST_MAG39-1228 [uncultured Sphingomonadaceae bacterium]|uniref:Uncharacterized protein n=1 Tax=uncultured Sphingomonadaceae bacterium TaxID=169976 RepID=A0A6J4SGK1_9SPHN|nr:MAG: hypothetical protein AVDCRST_MAG39-1228 [uncultured Sphingomonadaceae bacterium]